MPLPAVRDEPFRPHYSMSDSRGLGQRGLLVCFSSAIEAAVAAAADTTSYTSIPAAARGPPHRGVINRSSPLSNHRAPCDLPPIPRKWTCSFARAGWARRRSCAVWLWRCSRGGIRGSRWGEGRWVWLNRRWSLKVRFLEVGCGKFLFWLLAVAEFDFFVVSFVSVGLIFMVGFYQCCWC